MHAWLTHILNVPVHALQPAGGALSNLLAHDSVNKDEPHPCEAGMMPCIHTCAAFVRLRMSDNEQIVQLLLDEILYPLLMFQSEGMAIVLSG